MTMSASKRLPRTLLPELNLLALRPGRWARRRRSKALAAADLAREKRDYARAGTLYAQIVRWHPRDAAIHIQAGHMFKESGQYERAAIHYAAAERLLPDDPDLQLQLGHFAKTIGHLASAVAAYQLAAALAPGWEEPSRELAGLNAVTSQTPPDMLLDARKLALQRPSQTPAWRLMQRRRLRKLSRRADAARDASRHAEAAAAYEHVLLKTPAAEWLLVQCAHMHKEAGQMNAAERHYEAAHALMPEDAELQLQRGHFFKRAGRPAEAASAYRLAASLDPAGAGAREFSFLEPAVIIPQVREPNLPSRPPILFDEAYYRSGGAVPPGVDAWHHFLLHGAAAGRDPHWLFSTDFYLASYPDVGASGINPLLHFLSVGRQQGRDPHWLFSPALYLRLHPAVHPGDPIAHLLDHGLAEQRQPHPLFEPGFYLAKYLDIGASNMAAFEHFLKHGDAEGKTPHPLFDPAHYRAQHGFPPGSKAFEHYVRHGRHSSPHPLFDGAWYLQQRPELERDGTSPLLHYMTQGAAAALAPHPLFDAAYYRTQTAEPAALANPLMHYVAHGAAQGLSPNQLFDAAYYQTHSARSWDDLPLPKIGPRISVLVPVYNTPPDVLRSCIESVRNQTYRSWELCLADDCSTQASTIDVLAEYRGLDERIKICRTPRNLHISAATNFAAQHATGEFLAFLDHDDTIATQALAEIALAVTSHRDIDLLYTDEDKIDVDGRHCEPYRKPDWSVDHLYSVMYVLHFLVVRKRIFWELGGLRSERSGAQDYDLALRVSQVARRVHHIPRILYHWRMVPGSASAEVDAKPYALMAAREAVVDAVAASGAVATVEDGLLQGTFRVRYSLAEQPAVTLLITTNDGSRDVPGRGRINLVRNFIDSILTKSTYRNYRVIVVDNANSSAETRQLVERAGGRIISYLDQGPFNYARKANFGLRSVETDHLILLNDDLEVISPGWIEALLELSTQPAIGGVGARLLYPTNTVQHAGLVMGIYDSVAHVFMNLSADQVGYNGYTHLIRNYSAVTGAVFATRMSVIEEVGGLDEKLRIDFNDVDLCLRIRQKGKRIVYTPYCELYHFEGSTQVRSSQAPDEAQLFRQRWSDLIAHDPFYNPGSPRDRLNFV